MHVEPADNFDALSSALGAYYKQQSHIQLPVFEIPQPIERSYVNLALVEAKGQHARESSATGGSGVSLGTGRMDVYEDFFDIKDAELIQPDGLFLEGDSKRLLIVGRAGIGKSTFCQYVSYCWGKNEASYPSLWPQFSRIFWLPLRYLNQWADFQKDNTDCPAYGTKSKKTILARFIYYVLDAEKKKDSVFSIKLTEIESALQHPETCLFILDGYDEVSVEKTSTPDRLLHECLFKEPNYILTSRPHAVIDDPIFDQHSCLRYELMGFRDREIPAYVRQVYQLNQWDEDDETATKSAASSPALATTPDELSEGRLPSDKLVSILMKNENLWTLSHIPVNLALICSLQREAPEVLQQDNLTFTDLYMSLIDRLGMRYLEKLRPDMREKRPDIFRRSDQMAQLTHPVKYFLGELAFHGLLSGALLVKNQTLERIARGHESRLEKYLTPRQRSAKKAQAAITTDEDHDFFDEFLSTTTSDALLSIEPIRAAGFLKQAGTNASYFLHLTIQEYLSAYYLYLALKANHEDNITFDISHSEKTYTDPIHFIADNIDDRRYEIVWWFLSGLLKSDAALLKRFYQDALFNYPPVEAHIKNAHLGGAAGAVIQGAASVHQSLKNYLENTPDRLMLAIRCAEESASKDQLSTELTPYRQDLFAALNIVGESLFLPEDITRNTLWQRFIRILRISPRVLEASGFKSLVLELSKSGIPSSGIMGYPFTTYQGQYAREELITFTQWTPSVNTAHQFAEMTKLQIVDLLLTQAKNIDVRKILAADIKTAFTMQKLPRSLECEAGGLISRYSYIQRYKRKLLPDNLIDVDVSDETIDLDLLYLHALQSHPELFPDNRDASKQLIRFQLERLKKHEDALFIDLNKWLESEETYSMYVRDYIGSYDLGTAAVLDTIAHIKKIQFTLWTIKDDGILEAMRSFSPDTSSDKSSMTHLLIDKKGDLIYLSEGNFKPKHGSLIYRTIEDVRSWSTVAGTQLNIYEDADFISLLKHKGLSQAVLLEQIKYLDTRVDSRQLLEAKPILIGFLKERDHSLKNTVLEQLLAQKVMIYDDQILQVLKELLEAQDATEEICYLLLQFKKQKIEPSFFSGKTQLWDLFLHALTHRNAEIRSVSYTILEYLYCVFLEKNVTLHSRFVELDGISNWYYERLTNGLGQEKVAQIKRLLSQRLGINNLTDAIYLRCALVLGSEENLVDIIECVKSLGNRSGFIRYNAVKKLKRLGIEKDQRVIDRWIALLGDAESEVRGSAAASLGQLGIRDDKRIVDGLLKLLRVENSDVRRTAAESLERLGLEKDSRVVDRWIALLRVENSDVRSTAAQALGQLGIRDDKRIVDGLLKLLGDEDSYVRRTAAQALGQLGIRDDKRIVDGLLKLLGDKDSYVRSTAAESLEQLGLEKDSRVVDRWIVLLGDEESNVRSTAAQALERLGLEKDSRVVDRWIALLRVENSDVRRTAAQALGQLGIRDDKRIVDGLLKLLGDEKSNVQSTAAQALGQLGIRDDKRIVDDLKKLLDDTDIDVQVSTVTALVQLGFGKDNDVIARCYSLLVSNLEKLEMGMGMIYFHAEKYLDRFFIASQTLEAAGCGSDKRVIDAWVKLLSIDNLMSREMKDSRLHIQSKLSTLKIASHPDIKAALARLSKTPDAAASAASSAQFITSAPMPSTVGLLSSQTNPVLKTMLETSVYKKQIPQPGQVQLIFKREAEAQNCQRQLHAEMQLPSSASARANLPTNYAIEEIRLIDENASPGGAAGAVAALQDSYAITISKETFNAILQDPNAYDDFEKLMADEDHGKKIAAQR